MVDDIVYFYLFLETSNRRGTQFHAEKLSKFVLGSHLDPIGGQNDVQHLLIYFVDLAYLGLYLSIDGSEIALNVATKGDGILQLFPQFFTLSF